MDRLPWSAGACRDLASSLGLIPSRKKGQCFLPDRDAIDQIVAAAELAPGARVLEIGPGLGHLTAALLAAGAEVTAIDIDVRLTYHVSETLGCPALSVVCADALDTKGRLGAPVQAWLDTLGTEPGVVVSNLPYSIASPLLVLLLWSGAPLARLVACVQKEVADRLTAHAGRPAYGALSLQIQYAAAAESVLTLSRNRFWPRPDVTSTVVRLTPRPFEPTAADPPAFRALVRAAFHHRRKRLVRSVLGSSHRADLEAFTGPLDALRIEAGLGAIGAGNDIRAEALDLADVVNLSNALIQGP